MKVLKAIRVLGDVAEIIVGASIIIELVERYRGRKKTGSPANSGGLRKKFRQSKEEKLDIRNSSKLGSERFYFSIETLCKGIG